MKRLRSKFIFILLLLTLLPALALAILAKNVLEQTLELVLRPEIMNVANSALQAVQQNQTKERDRLASEMKRLAALLRQLPAESHRLEDSTHVIAVVDSTWRIRLVWPKGARIHFDADALTRAWNSDSLQDAGSDSLAIRLVLPLSREAVIVGQRPVSEELRRQFASVLAATQYFNLLNLEKSRLQRGLVLAFLAVYSPILLLSLAAGWYFARRVTAPLDALNSATRRLVQGDWQHRVNIRTRDEIGDLGKSFNAMVEDLQRQQEQVINLEKMAAWREIARVLAHEIKNPLTPIQLMAQQIRDEYHGPDEEYRKTLAECAGIIEEEIEKLRRLVREFSDFARMPELHRAPAQLNDLVVEVARLYVTRNVKLELAASLPVLAFDWEAMRRVLINLVENALQSSPAAEVSLQTRWQEERRIIYLKVTDTGPGISPENLRRVFEPYFSTKKSGMGLGLPIVKRIVEEHGGAITVKSEAGRGTEFAISLPCSTAIENSRSNDLG